MRTPNIKLKIGLKSSTFWNGRSVAYRYNTSIGNIPTNEIVVVVVIIIIIIIMD